VTRKAKITFFIETLLKAPHEYDAILSCYSETAVGRAAGPTQDDIRAESAGRRGTILSVLADLVEHPDRGAKSFDTRIAARTPGAMTAA
jgi:hypothetical protein